MTVIIIRPVLTYMTVIIIRPVLVHMTVINSLPKKPSDDAYEGIYNLLNVTGNYQNRKIIGEISFDLKINYSDISCS